MAAYREEGYRVEIVALAAPEAVGRLGILDRYPRFAEESRAHYVSWDNHTTCAAGLLATLTTVEACRLADRVLVVRRSAETALPAVYANELGPDGQWRRRRARADAVLAERRRPWDPTETGLFRRQLADADRRLADPRLPEDWSPAVRRDAERAAARAEPLRRTAQPRQEAAGVDCHRLSTDEHRWIFDDLIAPLLGPIKPQEAPVEGYVMAQPGAGKMPTTGAWQAQAGTYVRERRGDVVIEITPACAAAFVAGASLFRQAGYRVELVVLAVRAADSRQGTAARYAQVSPRNVPARFTTAAGHDSHFAVLPEVVATAEQLSAVDSVLVMRRDTHRLYHNACDGQGLGRGTALPRWPWSQSRPAPTRPRKPRDSGPSSVGCTLRCRITATTSSRSPDWHVR
ncbi:hypothetical protein J2Z21_008813 [Streptomyces griseochromogenes]|uniref:UDP-N-acetylglucosamine kinase n=3 Tax=Streptomyces griseochromogenes TaxID=68214 RepID=A0A1B1AYV4_9ACTN|nr:hypothetical protein AVL59_21140 [Streptomyces griseochromogenes]MBP2055797.1 hypothetical protein [Streptomyces griseochromogenes]